MVATRRHTWGKEGYAVPDDALVHETVQPRTRVRALSSMATRALLAELAGLVSAAGPAELVIESAGGVAVAERLRAGEVADLAVLASGAIEGLARDRVVRVESVRPLFVSEVVVAVPAGTGTPSVATVDALRSALLAAPRIGYSTGPSGDALLLLLAAWGLQDRLGERLVQSPPGVPVGRLLAEGGADLGFQQRSELVGLPGVTVLGPMPAGAEITTVFTGAVVAVAPQPDAARAMLAALAAPAVADVVRRHGLTPVG